MKKYRWLIWINLILLLLISFTAIGVNAKSDLSLNYSKTTTTSYKEITPSKLVEMIISSDISDQEKTYLDENYESLKYDDLIMTSKVTTNVTDEKLDVHAIEYSYTDSLNRVVLWKPYKAVYNGEEKELVKNGDLYETSFTSVASIEKVDVIYQLDLSIPAETVNELINSSYNYVNAYVVDKVYETNMELYNTNLALYNKYLEDLAKYNVDYPEYLKYLEQKEKYDKYLRDYSEYQSELERYNNYLALVNKYNEDLTAYQNYLSELNYYNENHEENKRLYDEYCANMVVVNKQLYVMNLIKTKMTSLERDVYDAVMGTAVTEVLDRQDELYELGVDRETMERANTATLNLREIFSQYFSYTEDSDKYAYYSANYYPIKKNVEELMRCLDKLYRSGLTNAALDYLDKTDKYLILVAQLALISNGLDDSPVYNYEAWNPKTNKGNLKLTGALVVDYNWTIGGKTITQTLENQTYLTEDGITALPLYSGYPEEVVELIKPTEVLMPTYPEIVASPVKPDEVSAPTATVTTLPVKPVKVDEPVEYVIPSDIASLLEVYNSGALKSRPTVSENYDLVLYTTVEKSLNNAEEITVEFYNLDKTLITKYTIPNGSYIVYDNVVPTKEKDAKYSYTFSGWEYEDHELIDLNHVTKEGFVYPVFTSTLNEYEVTWDIDGNLFKEKYHYQDLPECKETVVKENTDSKVYVFDSWDKDIDYVTGDVTYKAVFRDINVTSSVLKLDNVEDLSDVVHAITSVNDLSIAIEYDNYEITIPTSTLIKMMNDEVFDISLNITEDNGYKFNIVSSGENYTFDFKIKLEVDASHARLYNGDNQVRYSYSGGTLSFNMESNEVYALDNYYSINILKNDKVDFSVSDEYSKGGEIIRVSIDQLVNGININRVYYVTKSMEEIVIDSNEFEMPNDDVYIGISYSYIEYTITFISDKAKIKETKYHYGDVVKAPQNPQKASDDEFSYEFVGWDKEITEVNGDAVYTAVFESHPLDRPPVQSKVSIIKIAKIAFAVILAGCCVGLVIALTRKKPKNIKK